MTHHRLASTPETVCWGYWDASVPPVLRIESGDVVTIETVSGGPETVPDGRAAMPDLAAIHAGAERDLGPHILTGPIHVAGARPGDALAVRILDLRLRQDWGWMLHLPDWGALPERFPERRVIDVPLDRASMTARPHWGGVVPLAPFLGNFGVAPAPAVGRASSVMPREFGGNMDNKALTVGATVYFPVFVEGALFSAGDGHAAQGDGEVCVTAIETPLEATLGFSVISGRRLSAPRAETDAALISMGMHEDLDEAMRLALGDMIDWLAADFGMAEADAYSLCSIAGDLHVTQVVDVNKGVHCILPKAVLP
jgi:acetamidase/formamidase